MDEVLYFCALFCVTREEDTTVINDRLMEEKVSNCNKDMDIQSFFVGEVASTAIQGNIAAII